MSMRDLIGKLKDRPKTVDEHREAQKREWLAALEALFTDIERWVKPAVSAGVLATSRSTTEVLEQDFGTYQAPVLRIQGAELTVRIEPVGVRVVGVVSGGGRRLLGLKGRADLVCGPIRIPLVRRQTGDWQAVPLRGDPRTLDEESFAELLSEVLLDE
jgi:hypothetical protein